MSQAPEPGRYASCLPIGIPKQNYAKAVSRYATASRFCVEIE